MTTHGPSLGQGVSSVTLYDGISSSAGALMTMSGAVVLVSDPGLEAPLSPGLNSSESSMPVRSRVSISLGDSN